MFTMKFTQNKGMLQLMTLFPAKVNLVLHYSCEKGTLDSVTVYENDKILHTVIKSLMCVYERKFLYGGSNKYKSFIEC